MNQEFPMSTNRFLKASMFQDQEIPLTYLGWDKKGNEDREIKGQKVDWKKSLKYQLRYSYPEFAVDEAGERIVGKDGQPFQNKNWDADFPHGYSIVYHFEEGQLESGSLPLFGAFCLVRPKTGDFITISRTGVDKDTKWRVKKVKKEEIHASMNQQNSELPDIQIDEEDYHQ